MKKITLIFFFLIILMNLTGQNAVASNTGIDALYDGLPEAAGEMLSGVDAEKITDIDGPLKKIYEETVSKVLSVADESISSAVIIFTVAVVCSVAASVLHPQKGFDYVSLAGVAAICTAAVSGTGSLVNMAVQTVEDLQVFSASLMPVLAGASAASGAVTASAAKYAAVTLFVGIAANIIKSLIVPLIYIFLALSAAASSFNGTLKSAADVVKKAITWILNSIAIVFTLYITLSGTIASSADQMAVKLTKAAVSGVLPVVGGIISDAAEVVVSGADVLKNSISVFGMIAVCAVCAYPFLRMMLNVFVYRFTAILSSVIAPKPVTDFITAISDALILSLSAVGLATVMMFISLISFMKTVVS